MFVNWNFSLGDSLVGSKSSIDTISFVLGVSRVMEYLYIMAMPDVKLKTQKALSLGLMGLNASLHSDKIQKRAKNTYACKRSKA